MTNPNDAAFPESHPECPSPGRGITKRELFAAMAMQGLLSDPTLNYWGHDNFASEACHCADALIEVLNK